MKRIERDILVCLSLFALSAARVVAAGEAIEFHLRADQPGDTISRYLYGQFAEHLGRGIYEGIWVGEDSEIPNTRGFRNDVIAALKERFPRISGPDLKDICYATQNRQNAVRSLADEIDLLIVVGSANSSNSNRLAELGQRVGIPSYLVDGADELDPAWFEGKRAVGVSAGASAPEVLVQEILARLRELGVESVEEVPGEPETIVFRMPPELSRSPR